MALLGAVAGGTASSCAAKSWIASSCISAGIRGDTYGGFCGSASACSPLPVGSRLDAATGAFTWSPGVGFVGTYDLVFVRSAGEQASPARRCASSCARRAAVTSARRW